MATERYFPRFAEPRLKEALAVTAGDLRGLQKLKNGIGKHFSAGVALYDGEIAASFGEGMYAVPLSELWTK